MSPAADLRRTVEEHRAVDLRRIPLGAPDRPFLVHLVDDDIDRPADLRRHQLRGSPPAARP